MQKRLNNISLLRMVSFVLIIAYHLLLNLSPVSKWYDGWGGDFFPFYMSLQAFLFVSGYLYANKKIDDKKKFYKKELVKLLFPVLMLFVVFAILHLCIHPDSINPINFYHNFLADGYPFGHLWFVWFLVVCYLLIPFVQKALDKNNSHHKLYLSILLVCCIIEAIAEIIFSFKIVVCIFVFGMWYGKRQNDGKLENKKLQKILCAFVFTLSYVFFMLTRHCAFSENHFIYNLLGGFQHLMSGLIGTSFAILMLLCFEFLNKYNTPKILKFSDKYSYFIYLWHSMFMKAPLCLMFITPYVSLNIIITLFVGITTATIFGFLVQKLIGLIMTPKSPDPYKVIQKVLNDKDFK